MAHTLVIKGANFATNKIETVSFEELVPCTGIELDKDTSTITVIGGTDTLTATVTPEDTTDTVVWSSSNNLIATVANGVITTHGVGVVTITATCGEQTASCTLTSVNTLEFSHILSAYSTRRGESDDYPEINSSDGNYAALFGTESQTKRISYGGSAISGYPYPVPLGDGAETLTITAASNLKVTVVWIDKELPPVCSETPSQSWTDIYARVVNYDDKSAYNSNVPLGNRVLTVPEGANAVAVAIRKTSADLTDLEVNSVFFVVSAGLN